MKKSVKYVSLLLALLSIVLCAVSCSGGTDMPKDSSTAAPKETEIDITALGSALAKVRYEDEMAEITDEAVLSAIYPEVTGAVKKVVYGGSGATPEEIILCEYESEEAAGKAVSRFEKHLSDKKGIFDGYNVQYRPLLDKAILENVGRYIVYSVSSDPDAAKAVIDAAK